MTKKIIQWLFIGLLTMFVSTACATSAMTQKEKTDAYRQFIVTEKLEPLDKITSFKFDDWSPLGDEHLIISTSVRKMYLITLSQRCSDLRFANAIKIHNTGSSLSAKFDSISVPAVIEIKCYIKSIHRVTKEQKKALQKIGKED